jgi:hypothetical protein
MDGRTSYAIMAFATLLKRERAMEKAKQELADAVLAIPEEDVSEYVAVTTRLQDEEDKKNDKRPYPRNTTRRRRTPQHLPPVSTPQVP